MKSHIILGIVFILALFKPLFAEPENHYDIVIYGGTSAGIAAAIQASRMDHSVVIIEPTNRLGGLTTGGLGQTDIGNKQSIGGIAREFYQGIRKYYDNPANWRWQKKEDFRDVGQARTDPDEDTKWTFEPSAGLTVFHKMLAEEDISFEYAQRLNRETGVIVEGGRIVSIEMESGEIYTGRVFIDATYEGDLMASAGVTYAIGREPNSQYGETLNGVQDNYMGTSLLGTQSRNQRNHNFVDGVDPYIIPGDPGSGVLPGIDVNGPGESGAGDKRIQAYCFRMTLTDHPENRIPFFKPEGYDEINYELLFRNYEAGFDGFPWINSSMPNRKTDTNNRTGFSTNLVGGNYGYPEGTYQEREEIRDRIRKHQQGLMWTLANHSRIPQHIRDEISRWGTCKDEYDTEDGWQNQVYVREARRMVSDFVMTQHYCEGLKVVDDSIGMAAYTMDSHNVQRYITPEGWVKNEGNVECRVPGPYSISYKAIRPKAEDCTNLLVPICISASHIAFGSMRMEPVFMVLGQSAATAASLAIEYDTFVQQVDYSKLRDRLLAGNQVLE